MKYILSIALVALLTQSTNAHKLTAKNSGNLGHACDYVDEQGEEIDTSLAV